MGILNQTMQSLSQQQETFKYINYSHQSIKLKNGYRYALNTGTSKKDVLRNITTIMKTYLLKITGLHS